MGQLRTANKRRKRALLSARVEAPVVAVKAPAPAKRAAKGSVKS
jgi:hypothetical protein